MRIVIDMQGAQSTDSRNRGIGRYSLSLALAMVRNRGEHEVLIALNGHFADTIESIGCSSMGPAAARKLVWGCSPMASINTNDWRRQSAELVRQPASGRMWCMSSLFEGLVMMCVQYRGVVTDDPDGRDALRLDPIRTSKTLS
jgi:hypothetical protein